MITLITGEPGNGKTAYAVHQLVGLLAKEERPVFVWGVKDLTIPHTVCPALSAWTRREAVPEDPSLVRDVFDFPSGSVVLIDECQDVFRVRAASSKVPPHVSALETHRHQGLDFLLVTQKASQIDTNVRGLVGRHIHLKSNWAGRKLLEWSECRNPLSRTDCGDAVTRPYKLPSSVFGLYTSATVHNVPKRRLPVQLAVFVGGLLLVVGAALYGWGRAQDLQRGSEEAKARAGTTVDDAPGAAAAVEPRPTPFVSVDPVRSTPMRLTGSVYLAVGGEVLQRHWYASDGEGGSVRVEGGLCVGEGSRAVCHVEGRLVQHGGGIPSAPGSVTVPSRPGRGSTLAPGEVVARVGK